jgi:hypothetical protein
MSETSIQIAIERGNGDDPHGVAAFLEGMVAFREVRGCYPKTCSIGWRALNALEYSLAASSHLVSDERAAGEEHAVALRAEERKAAARDGKLASSYIGALFGVCVHLAANINPDAMRFGESLG